MSADLSLSKVTGMVLQTGVCKGVSRKSLAKLRVCDRLIPGGDFPFTEKEETRQKLMKTWGAEGELTGSDR